VWSRTPWVIGASRPRRAAKGLSRDDHEEFKRFQAENADLVMECDVLK